tara:strand:+ start:124 stop:657 length:534 start_codon:yes stop_codon:yes gene_type:complete
MDKPKAPQNTAQATNEVPGFWQQFAQGIREERSKGWLLRGLLRQQKQMAVSDRQARFFSEAKGAVAKARRLKVAPTRVETFEEAIARQGLSEEFLYSQMQRHKWVHLGLYLVAGALLVHAFWMFLNSSAFMALGVLIASFAVAVNGYIHGFRAWQIENRNLIRLQDALRIPGTYLVL